MNKDPFVILKKTRRFSMTKHDFVTLFTHELFLKGILFNKLPTCTKTSTQLTSLSDRRSKGKGKGISGRAKPFVFPLERLPRRLSGPLTSLP